MQPEPSETNVIRHVAQGTHKKIIDIFGPTVEFLRSPEDARGDFCVMRGVIPPGVSVPLHSHDETESFFVISGRKQVLMPGPRGLEWTEVHAGDYVQVPQGVRHAHRNVSGEPLIELVITTARLGRWFQEAGTPLTAAPRPPTREDLARLIAVSAKYGYWLGSPEENSAAGIYLPELAGDGDADK
ncbi:MAG: cupin domain-containing protein [Streptosporangiaceae bacterium]